MDKLSVRSDEVISSNIKLKDYLKLGINEASDDYINTTRLTDINKDDALKLIIKYRNILLCINEICKTRKKY